MIEAHNISKKFSKGKTVALDSASITLGKKGLVAITGPAASGKTTLLNIFGGIEHPDTGELLIDGISSKTFHERDWNTYRNARVAFLFQETIFVKHLTTLENVALSLLVEGIDKHTAQKCALDALKKLGIENCASQKPAELSSAQLRLMMAARALVKDCDILLADDPISGLDNASFQKIIAALKEASKTKLVILATSDENLAAQSADRIIQIESGKIVSDKKNDTASAAGQKAEEYAHSSTTEHTPINSAAHVANSIPKRTRASMPFLQAVSYSVRSIFAKKGRAIITSFAAAISIIGIASIIALNTGAYNLIVHMEEASLDTEPIVISKSNLDLTGLLGSDSFKKYDVQVASEGEQASQPGSAKVNSLKGSIEGVSSMLMELISYVRDNDLSGFKQYLDSGAQGISNYVESIQYDYGTAPLIYDVDMSNGVEQLNPSTLSSLLNRRANSTTATLNRLSGFNEMITDQDILDEHMDILTGRWPQSYDECVVVLDNKGGISDYTLYCIGLYDHEAVKKATEAALTGDNIELPDTPRELTYDRLMESSFLVLPRVSLYQKNTARGTWANKSFDDEYVKEKLSSDGIRLKVTGIVQPKKDSPAALLREGIAYTHDLTEHLINISAESEITKEQIQNPSVDVFTKKPFDELKKHPAGNLDLENIITLNEEAIGRLLSIFEGEEEAEPENDSDLDILGVDLSKIDWSKLKIDPNNVLLAADETEIKEAIALTGNLIADFSSYAISKGAKTEDLSDPKKAEKYWKEYIRSPQGKKKINKINKLLNIRAEIALNSDFETYISKVYAEAIIREAAQYIIEESLYETAYVLDRELERALPGIVKKLGTEIEKGIASELDNILTGAEKVAIQVENELPNVIQINMTEEDLVAYLNNLTDSSEIGYDNNMAKLGYADVNKPQSISIYPKDLNSKQKVIEIISSYNTNMEKLGMPERKIIFNDYAGDVSKALTSGVDILSLILIALEIISLVVASLVMAVITYIGISERRREMGLLRSLGASRSNLMTMFNTETFLEGLVAGVFAVCVVLISAAGINGAMIAQGATEDILVLPPMIIVGLIALSALLPMLTGLAASFILSRKKPAQSLRS